MRARGPRTVAALLVATGTLSGCGLGNGLYNTTLPGGADVGDHPYTVTAKFRDARDLVPQSGVKVNDVAVGRVSRITLDRAGTTASVEVELNSSVRLPANAVASIQQTSLLGEKYVALSAPLSASAQGRLRNGATIDVRRTTNGVEVEQIFGALSMLLNGGGIGQLKDINTELNKFAGGRESDIRTFFASVNTVVTRLNANRASITRALDSLATLSGTLRKQNSDIRSVLTDLAPGLDVITAQRTQLVQALNAFNRLSAVTVRTLDASKDDIIADLKTLSPILRQLALAGSALPQSLQVLLTYPFSDGALAGIKGDYLNTYITTALRTPGGKVYAQAAVAPLPGSGPRVLPAPAGLLPATSSAAAGLPSTLSLSTPGRPSAARPGGSGGSTSGSASGSAPGSSSGSASSRSGTGSATGSSSGSTSGSAPGSSSQSSSEGGR